MKTYREEQNVRSRKIKAALIERYGKDNVSVRKGRGTAHEWVYVTVALPQKTKPKNWKAQYAKERTVIEETEKIIEGIRGITLAQYGSDTGMRAGNSSCLLVRIEWE